MILREESAHDWLYRTEQEATQHLKNAVHSWIAFCKLALAIQDSGLWHETAKTWAEYVRQTWDIDSSRIRQYKGALPYADKLMEVIPDVATPEANIRKLKKAIDPDHPLMPQVYRLGMDVAEELDTTVQTSFFEHALEVLETENTSGLVDIAGVQVPGNFENARKFAVIQEIDEAKQRLKNRLLSGKQSYTVTAKRVSDNQYLITSDEVLPETFQFKLWKDSE